MNNVKEMIRSVVTPFAAGEVVYGMLQREDSRIVRQAFTPDIKHAAILDGIDRANVKLMPARLVNSWFPGSRTAGVLQLHR